MENLNKVRTFKTLGPQKNSLNYNGLFIYLNFESTLQNHPTVELFIRTKN